MCESLQGKRTMKRQLQLKRLALPVSPPLSSLWGNRLDTICDLNSKKWSFCCHAEETSQRDSRRFGALMVIETFFGKTLQVTKDI